VAKLRPVLIMAGGTGGHIYPALAVARELMARGIPVVWLGTRKGMESRIIPSEGIDIKWLSVSGMRGKKFSKLLLAPFLLLLSGLQALWVVISLRPRAVLGMGGFVTGPGGVAARLLFRPLCIHEQNAIAGMTNKMLSKIANFVCSAFPAVFDREKNYTVTGNPVRADIVALPEPAVRLQSHTGRLRLLVIGGSLGAQAINEALPKALAMMPEEQRPQVRHQAGERNFVAAQSCYTEAGIEVALSAFIEDMAEAYSWADLVLCRSGALTVSELAAAGVGAILVPYPHAVDDHQTANAEFLTKDGAARLLPQTELTPAVLVSLLTEFNQDKSKLIEMAVAARALAITDSAKQVADICLSLGKS